MSLSQPPTLTIFGATGGCGASTLADALNAGISCTAMVRTPSKLLHLLKTTHNIPSSRIETHLTITQGNIKSTADIKRALTTGGHLPDRILFAVGGAPKHQLSLSAPATLDDPHVCEEGMKALVSVLRSCAADNIPYGPLGRKLSVIAISATGVSNRRDIRLHLYPIYQWYLSIPLNDKAGMEKCLTNAALEADSVVGDFAVVRIMALSDGPAKGAGKIKSGWTWPDEQREEKVALGEEEDGPKKGLFVSRKDVGAWVFDKLVKGDGMHYGKCTTLTY